MVDRHVIAPADSEGRDALRLFNTNNTKGLRKLKCLSVTRKLKCKAASGLLFLAVLALRICRKLFGSRV